MGDRELRLKATLDDAASRGLLGIGRAADQAGDALDDAAGDAAHLEREAERAEAALRDLAREFSRTTDAASRMDLAKAMRKQQAEIRQLSNVKDLLMPDPAEVVKVGARIGPLMISGLKTSLGGMGGVIAAGAVAAGPTIGAGIAAAVVGGAAGAGIVGGLVIAARHPAVKAAGADLGKTMLADLETRASVFVGPAIRSIGIVRAEYAGMGADISRMFSATSRQVEPLARSLGTAGRSLVAGLADAAERSGPVMSSLNMMIERVGAAAGDAFSTMAEDSDEAALAIDDLAGALEGVIRITAGLAHILAQMKGGAETADVWIDKARYWIEDSSALAEKLRAVGVELDITADGFAKGTPEAEAYRRMTLGVASAADLQLLAQAKANKETQTGAAAAQVAASAASRQGVAAGEAAAHTDRLAAAMHAMANRALAASNSEIALEQAIDDATAAARANGRTLDINTAKGRANRTALNGIASAALNAAEELRGTGGSQADVSRVMERGRTRFIAAATAMGMGSQKAKELANKLFGIPDNTNPKVNVDAGNSFARIKAIRDALNRVPGSKTVTIRTVADIPAGLSIGALMREHGGPVKKGHAYVVGERRPEVFVPDRDGKIIPSVESYQRMSGAGGSGATGSPNFHIGNLVLQGVQSPEQMVRELQRYADNNGGIRLKVRT